MRPLHSPIRILIRLALGASLCLPVRAATAQPPIDSATVAEQYLLAAANQDRAALGLRPLHRSPLLASVARQHAMKMASHQAISHQFSGEPQLTSRGATAGLRFSVISENVGEAPSAVRIHDLWMHSTEHRTNLLDPAIDSAGISVVARGGELYAVEDFTRTVQIQSLEDQESAIGALIARSNAIRLDADATINARETCEMSTGYAGNRRPWFVMRFTSDSLAILPDELKTRLASGRFHLAAVGACAAADAGPFTAYNIAVMLYP